MSHIVAQKEDFHSSMKASFINCSQLFIKLAFIERYCIVIFILRNLHIFHFKLAMVH